MLYNYGARRYFEQPVYLRNVKGEYVAQGELTMPLHFCVATAQHLYQMQDIALKAGSSSVEEEIKLFIHAAHVVFVPFGQAGYDFLTKVVSEKLDGKSVGDFLYEEFVRRVECPLNGNLLKDLSDEQKEYIKEFFVSFGRLNDIDCSRPKEVATLVCRLYFAIDALWGVACREIQDLVEKYITPIENEIIDFENEVFKCKISDFIGRIPTHKALNEQEENYILELFKFA